MKGAPAGARRWYMEQSAIDVSLVRRYLLGELAEDERELLEQRLLTDDDFYETFTALEEGVEDELIEEYADGELRGTARENFSHVIMSTPTRVEKLKLVKDLKGRVVPATAPTSWWQRPPLNIFHNPRVGLSCAAVLLLLLFSLVWLVVRSNRLEARIGDLQARVRPEQPPDAGLKEELERLRGSNEELAESLRRAEAQRGDLEQELTSLKKRDVAAVPEKVSPPARRTSVFSLFLPATQRSGTGEERERVLTLPAGAPPAARASLILGVENLDAKDYKNFSATVSKKDGPPVWKSDRVRVSANRRSRKGRAALQVPVSLLPDGVYVVELNGLTVDDETDPLSYVSFRVTRK